MKYFIAYLNRIVSRKKPTPGTNICIYSEIYKERALDIDPNYSGGYIDKPSIGEEIYPPAI
jgi:hypothetical protein